MSRIDRFSRGFLWLSGLAVVSTASGLAHGQDPVTACLDAHQQAQALRLKQSFLEAREQMVRCAGEACPSLVQADCARWLVEVEPQIPSVLFKVRVNGVEQYEVKVYRDDTLLLEEITSTAMRLNPGKYTFGFEVPGFERTTRTVTLTEGEKYRLVSVDFTREEPGAVKPPPQPPAARAEPVRRIPTLSYILGGVGVAGLAGFGALAVTTSGKEDELRSSCAPVCTEEDVDELKTRYLIGDIALAAGALAVAGAITVYYITPKEMPGPSLTVQAAPAAGGGFATVTLRAF